MQGKVVILGSTGFIGNALCTELECKGVKFLGLATKDVNLLSQEQASEVLNLIEKDDIVVFMSTIIPSKDEKSYNNNLLLLKNFTRAINKKKLNHLIYISSDAVYDDNVDRIKENSEKNKSNLYSKMHLDREYFIKEFSSQHELDLTILRPTAVYGPGDTHNSYGPNKFIRAINEGKNIVLFGKGEESRDHIFILDLTKIISEVINKKILGTYTVATGQTLSFNELAKLICSIKKVPYSRIEFQKREGPLPDNINRNFDISKLKNNIPDLEFTKINHGIKETMNKIK